MILLGLGCNTSTELYLEKEDEAGKRYNNMFKGKELLFMDSVKNTNHTAETTLLGAVDEWISFQKPSIFLIWISGNGIHISNQKLLIYSIVTLYYSTITLYYGYYVQLYIDL